jgi:hypothetical protein
LWIVLVENGGIPNRNYSVLQGSENGRVVTIGGIPCVESSLVNTLLKKLFSNSAFSLSSVCISSFSSIIQGIFSFVFDCMYFQKI